MVSIYTLYVDRYSALLAKEQRGVLNDYTGCICLCL